MTEETIQDRINRRKASLDAVLREEADLRALATLIDNNGMSPAPSHVDFIAPDYQLVTVGIGRDHVASIYITTADLRELRRLLGKEEPDGEN